MPRAEFKEATKGLIAARAGYRCSFPDCDHATIGPGAAQDKIASIGTAAHIFAASEGGPRGSGGLSDEELALPQNGIWLCANHGRLVDTNRGNRYPPQLLLSYKTLQEARISRELQGITSPFAWLHEIRVCSSPIFSPHTTVRLGKLNLLVGDNGTGKSAFCEWIAGFADLRHLERWRRRASVTSPINVFLKLFQPEEQILELRIANTTHIECRDGDATVPLHARPLRIMYPKSRVLHDTNGLNDLQLMAFLLDLHESEVLNLCNAVQSYEYSTVKNMRFQKDEEGVLRLHVDVSGTAPGLDYHMLSGREQERVFIELATAAARAYAKYTPTLLILDASVTIFFEAWFDFYANHFNDASSLFQTLVVIPTRDFDLERIQWLGWEIIRTKGQIPNITIEQSIRAASDS